MSDRDLARHRSDRRASTPLSDVGDAVTESLTVVGRSSAVLAVSTGLIATVGLPGQAYGAEARATPQTSSETASLTLPAAAPAGGLLAAPAITTVRTGPLSALTTATLAFEADAFTAVPTVTRHRERAVRATTARHAVTSRSTAPIIKTPPTKAPVAKTPLKKTPIKKAPIKKAPVVKAPVVKHPKPPAPVHKSPVSTPAPTGSARGSAVLAIAARYVGTPYVYGGMTPHGFDCSGFVGYVYRQLGVALPRTANQQLHATHRIARSQARAGDLVFFTSGGRAYHVGIYAGHGQMYDSPHTGARVGKRKIWTSAVVFGRPTG